MNKKIYFSDYWIQFLSSESQVSEYEMVNLKRIRLNDKNELGKYCREFLTEPKNLQIFSQTIDFEVILKELKKEFQYIEAAGGFIEKENTYLFIHRNGRWDLPKGKLEKNETIPNAAIRECEEECGVEHLSIVKSLSSSFHLYPYKKDFALKQSYWFYMTTKFNGPLIPQTNESIDKAVWLTKSELLQTVLPDTYYTIRDVITEALDLSN